ncbi:MAG: magnesium transporter MgtC [Bacillota bacterium]|nr:MAG: magnesium transporter MgtC [Bacillota bacterium]
MKLELICLIRIVYAVLLGFAIGFERKLRFKEAGIRTHTIVCAGAALIMIVSKYAFSDVNDYDASRVAAQIVSGIGFLGAGMIIYRKQAVHGLTTAAGVWATAGVGMAAGGGLYIVAAGAAMLLIAVQCILHLRCKLFTMKKYLRIRVVFENVTGEESSKITALFGVERFSKLNVERGENLILCTGTITTDRDLPAVEIGKILSENNFIRSIERCDDE